VGQDIALDYQFFHRDGSQMAHVHALSRAPKTPLHELVHMITTEIDD